MEDLESLIKINQYKINETDTCGHSANSYTKPTVNIEKNTMRRIRKNPPKLVRVTIQHLHYDVNVISCHSTVRLILKSN